MPAHTPSDGAVERAKLFGMKVRQARQDLGVSERAFIERTGLSRSYVQLLESGRGSWTKPADEDPANPSMDVIWVLAQALEIGVDYLVDPTQPVRSEA